MDVGKTLYEIFTGEKPPMGLSADDKLLMERIEIDFKYHAPNGATAEKFITIRQKAKELALVIVGLCSESPERKAAISKLEECMFWANAGIARNGKHNES